MTNITAKMAHSKESVELMCITQYNTFEFGKKIALLVISAALIVFGVVELMCITQYNTFEFGKKLPCL